jgi:colicin import membrane protein
MIVDRQRLSSKSLARLAVLVSVFLLTWMPVCNAQMFGLPGRFTRTDIAPSQQTPPAAPPQVPKRTGNAAAHWGPLFKDQVERCWKKPGGGGKEPIEAIFVIKLNRDGMIDEARPISITSTTPYSKAYQMSCMRALENCQPYRLPDAYYDEWRFFEPVFTERIR